MGTHLKFSHPWITEVQARIYVLTLPSDRTREETRLLWEHIRSVFADNPQPERFGWISVMQFEESHSWSRKLAAEHLDLTGSYIGRNCIAMYSVTDTPVTRGAITAVEWLREMPARDGTTILRAASVQEATELILNQFAVEDAK